MIQKKLLKFVLEKTAFIKFRISNNIDETHSKQPKIRRKIHTSIWILKIYRKTSTKQVSRLSPKVCDFQKENHTLGYGFKNLKKIYSLAKPMDFYSL
jgi:hypothetical protein